MEQRIARLEERQGDTDKAIERIDRQQAILETKMTNLDKTMAVMENNLEYTRNATARIEGAIEQLRKDREQDHFIKPLGKQEARYEKIWWAVIGGGITFLVGAVLAAIASLI